MPRRERSSAGGPCPRAPSRRRGSRDTRARAGARTARRTRGSPRRRRWPDSSDRVREVRDEIANALDADREPDEARGRRELGALPRAVSHRERDLDERLDAPERLREREDLRARRDALRRGLPARLQLEAEHPAEAPHLPAC